MPKLAAFPKAFMQALCKEGSMTVSEWIKLASTLDVTRERRKSAAAKWHRLATVSCCRRAKGADAP